MLSTSYAGPQHKNKDSLRSFTDFPDPHSLECVCTPVRARVSVYDGRGGGLTAKTE